MWVVSVSCAVVVVACGGTELSAASSCADFNAAATDDQVRWVRATFDPGHAEDQFEFQGLMDAVAGHCGVEPDDSLQALLGMGLGTEGASDEGTSAEAPPADEQDTGDGLAPGYDTSIDSGNEVVTTQAEGVVQNHIREARHVRMDVSCPGGVPFRAGQRFTCDLAAPNGTAGQVEVIVNDGLGFDIGEPEMG